MTPKRFRSLPETTSARMEIRERERLSSYLWDQPEILCEAIDSKLRIIAEEYSD